MTSFLLPTDLISLSTRHLTGHSAFRTFARRAAAVSKPNTSTPPPLELDINFSDGFELIALGELDHSDDLRLPAPPQYEVLAPSRLEQHMRAHTSRPRPPRRVSSTSSPGNASLTSSGFCFPDLPSPTSPSSTQREFQDLVDTLKQRESAPGPSTPVSTGSRRRSRIVLPTRAASEDTPSSLKHATPSAPPNPVVLPSESALRPSEHSAPAKIFAPKLMHPHGGAIPRPASPGTPFAPSPEPVDAPKQKFAIHCAPLSSSMAVKVTAPTPRRVSGRSSRSTTGTPIVSLAPSPVPADSSVKPTIPSTLIHPVLFNPTTPSRRNKALPS